MPTKKSPRKGSLQFWPRKRASKFLPRVNWSFVKGKKILKGFIVYKAGMASAIVKDTTPNSMTLNKQIAVPVTILEAPTIKIFSVRFYKDSKVMKDVIVEHSNKELKKKLKMPKQIKNHAEELEKIKDYDDITIIVYSQVKKTNLKKTPDMSEIGLNGTLDEKLNFVKEKIGKEISVSEFFEKNQVVDLRGLTKGKGLQGPVKRFGITLKQHKSEKGQRRPGSLGPWHPARVTFRVPQAGQLGMFTRVIYNNKILDLGKAEEKFKNIKNYGNLKTDYVIVCGSVQGTAKRQLVLTASSRETKKQTKKHYELLEMR